ncbi:hypothetical protein FIV38_28935 [Pseudomonas proteolytica]|nr:hypothetical protein F4W61_28710 [Pseudomonas proteolytica]TWR71541.1 hypothetical protein FIV38_28935 [Pseudomonas proteolytica]
MLAKNVNDNAGLLDARGALRFFASKLAPTGAHGLPAMGPGDRRRLMGRRGFPVLRRGCNTIDPHPL